jgi:ArsR family transcriptional regulator
MPQKTIMHNAVEKLVYNRKLAITAKILRAVSHPLRLQIISFIDTNKKINVNSIYQSLHLEQSRASQHLRILRDTNIVSTQREGKFIYYSLNYPLLQLIAEVVDSFLGS